MTVALPTAPAMPWVARPERYSATRLKDAENCMLLHRFRVDDDPSGMPARVGNVFHDVAAALTFRAQIEGRARFTEDEAEATARAFLNRPTEAAPLGWREFQMILALTRRWAAHQNFDHEHIVQVEQSHEHELEGVRLSARLDLLSIEDNVAYIEDYKTSMRLPTREEVEDHVQLPIYAWHVVQEFPQVEHFNVAEVYTRFGQGGVPIRVPTFGLERVAEVEDWLSTTVRRLEAAWSEQDFPATPGAWCANCPGKRECPLPERVRPAAITDDEEAARQAGAMLVEKARVKEREDGLRAYLDPHEYGSVVVGGKRVGYTESTQNTLDRKAAERDLDLTPYLAEKTSTSFGVRNA